MKLNFSIISLSEHKIGLNTPNNNISLPSYTFFFDETKSTHGGTDFFINEKYSYTKQSELNNILDPNLELTFIETNLPQKGTSYVAVSINILTCQYLTLI